MVESTRDDNGRAQIAERIRRLDREIFDGEMERSHLASRAGDEGPAADSMKGLTDAEDRLRALRAERRRLEEHLDSLRQADALAQVNLNEKRISEIETKIQALSAEKERLITREIPDARRKAEDLENRFRHIEQEIRDLIRAASQLKHHRK